MDYLLEYCPMAVLLRRRMGPQTARRLMAAFAGQTLLTVVCLAAVRLSPLMQHVRPGWRIHLDNLLAFEVGVLAVIAYCLARFRGGRHE